jgi:hypothetical protein
MHLDDAIRFLVDLAKGRHRPTDYAKYGYEIYLLDAVTDIEQVSCPFSRIILATVMMEQS